MYTLYFLPGACSLATHTILNEIQQPFTLIHKKDAHNYAALNPAGTVPVLVDGEHIFNEGVAILLYLLNKHENALLPSSGMARQKAIENMLFANASMHPAYSRLFFIEQHITDPNGKKQALHAATQAINHLWQVVEKKLESSPLLGGETLSPADILLTVYARWGAHFPVPLTLGASVANMLNLVEHRKSFQQALQRENAYLEAISREPIS